MAGARSRRGRARALGRDQWIGGSHLTAIEYNESRARFAREQYARELERRSREGETYLNQYGADEIAVDLARRIHRLDRRRAQLVTEKAEWERMLEPQPYTGRTGLSSLEERIFRRLINELTASQAETRSRLQQVVQVRNWDYVRDILASFCKALTPKWSTAAAQGYAVQAGMLLQADEVYRSISKITVLQQEIESLDDRRRPLMAALVERQGLVFDSPTS